MPSAREASPGLKLNLMKSQMKKICMKGSCRQNKRERFLAPLCGAERGWGEFM
jgi:hypothetical protein